MSEQSDSAGHNPDATFSDFNHAYVCGVVAAAISSSELVGGRYESSKPSIIVQFGPRRYELLIRELQ